MALEVWRRVVSAGRPCSFDSRSGMLELRTCSLMGDGKASRLSCKVAGSALTVASLSESTPCSKIRSLFQENVEFSCNGGEILVVGALLPRLPSRRGVKRSSPAVEAEVEAPAAKRAATTPTVVKSIGQDNGLVGRSLTPTPPAAASSKNKKSATPISHRVLNSGLAYDVLKVGSGAMAARGKPARVRYEGQLAATGQTFDSGAVKFRLGMGEVIRAWDEGIQGMLVGELRRLYVPARLGYGAEGRPPAIPSGAGLIFEVELLQC